MFHGVSVGEVIALENLIKLARETFKDCRILITTGTKTGQDIAKKNIVKLQTASHIFLLTCRFALKVFSKTLILILYLWQKLNSRICLHSMPNAKNIPLLLINGRISR